MFTILTTKPNFAPPCTDGKQTYEKMLNITHHQKKANQNHNDVSLHPCQNGYYQKVNKSVGKSVKNRESSHTVVGTVYGAANVENSIEVPRKVKNSPGLVSLS